MTLYTTAKTMLALDGLPEATPVAIRCESAINNYLLCDGGLRINKFKEVTSLKTLVEQNAGNVEKVNKNIGKQFLEDVAKHDPIVKSTQDMSDKISISYNNLVNELEKDKSILMKKTGEGKVTPDEFIKFKNESNKKIEDFLKKVAGLAVNATKLEQDLQQLLAKISNAFPGSISEEGKKLLAQQLSKKQDASAAQQAPEKPHL